MQGTFIEGRNEQKIVNIFRPFMPYIRQNCRHLQQFFSIKVVVPGETHLKYSMAKALEALIKLSFNLTGGLAAFHVSGLSVFKLVLPMPPVRKRQNERLVLSNVGIGFGAQKQRTLPISEKVSSNSPALSCKKSVYLQRSFLDPCK